MATIAQWLHDPVGYCPKCGARLSFDVHGGPVVESREAAIARSVAEERRRLVSIANDQWSSYSHDHTDGPAQQAAITCLVDAMWPEPAQEEASDGE